MPVTYRLSPITKADAREMCSWQYESPYDIYNADPEAKAETIAWLLTPKYQYHAIYNEQDEMIAFCCYGEDATVPGGGYSDDALDIGLGLRPDLTGQGLGPAILEAILQHAIKSYEPDAFRATIATFNERSQRLFRKLWFAPESEFIAKSGRPFVIMRRPA